MIMLPDEMTTEETELRGEGINLRRASTGGGECPKSNGVAANGLPKESNGFTAKREREDAALAEERKDSSTRYFEQQLIWHNVVAIGIFHALALYSFLTFPYVQRWKTAVFAWMTAVFASFGVGAGVHRLWTHRSYKAKTPLRILLLCCYSTAGMNSIFDWVRDHRVHHKFSDTDADPHNSNRGFFFSHVGWLMMRKHPDVTKKGRLIDMSDVAADPVVAFGEKYFIPLKILFCFVLPTIIPVYFWNEDWYYAITSQVFMRYSFVLNATWCVNSVAHMFGWRPYDKTIAPVENMLISYMTGGEGWHNYHHVFPWDYKTSEIGHMFVDLSTYFIRTFSAIGWAYDLKQPSADLIRSTIAKKGDGTYHGEVPAPSEESKATM